MSKDITQAAVAFVLVLLFVAFILGSTFGPRNAMQSLAEDYCTDFRPHFALNADGTWECLTFAEKVEREEAR